jgi:hypothetical protein
MNRGSFPVPLKLGLTLHRVVDCQTLKPKIMDKIQKSVGLVSHTCFAFAKRGVSILTILFLLVVDCCDSQNWYGRQTYTHDSTFLVSARRTLALNNEGFIMGGYRPISPGTGRTDFVIDKTDENGQFPNANDFSKSYKITANACGTSTPPHQSYGIDVVEMATPANNEYYAVAGAYNEGVFLLTLDAAGAPVRNIFYAFPNVGTTFVESWPSICESSTPGHFYICGAYRSDKAYVIKVNATGGTNLTTDWSWFYDANYMQPKDIIQSPYNSSDIIVVGRCDPGGSTQTTPPSTSSADAFFMKLNATSGVVSTFSLYHSQYWHGDEWFNCIEPANANGATNYIVGGRSHYSSYSSGISTPVNTPYTQWMCRLTSAGAIQWSTLIEPKGIAAYIAATGTKTLGGLPAEISGVYERLNPNTLVTEYYGVADNQFYPSGVVKHNACVYKLNNVGSTGTISPNEFHYRPNQFRTSDLLSRAQITGIESGSVIADGIQVYGTTTNAADHFFVKAYFNGKSGCNDTAVTVDNVYQGPDSILTRSVARTSFPDCNFNGVNGITFTTVVIANHGTVCAAATVSGGSNGKITTALSRMSGTDVTLYPNPTHGRLFLSAEAENLLAQDLLGKKYYIYCKPNEAGVPFVDLSQTLPASGIYIISGSIGGKIFHSKITYDYR